MNPRAQYDHLVDELNARIAEVVASGRFILGPSVTAFEEQAAAYLGVKHAIGVANGTDALVLSLRALGIGRGDEVICPSYTFYATAEAIAAVGATPVFADIDEQTYCLDVASVRERITGRTRAIMPVHLFGTAADMDELMALAKERDLAVTEDSAQAWGTEYKGRKVGSFGDAATFSFFPTKNLPCFGDGGMVVTNRDDVAERIRKLRFHGSTDKVRFEHVGYNSRLDEIQAAVLQVLMREVDGWNASRARVADRYRELGLGDVVTLPHVGDDRTHIYHLYMVRADGAQRDALVAALGERGIGAAVYYREALHLQPVFRDLGGAPGDLPVTEALSAEGVALPMYPTMTDAEVAEVVAAVRAAAPVSTPA